MSLPVRGDLTSHCHRCFLSQPLWGVSRIEAAANLVYKTTPGWVRFVDVVECRVVLRWTTPLTPGKGMLKQDCYPGRHERSVRAAPGGFVLSSRLHRILSRCCRTKVAAEAAVDDVALGWVCGVL